AASASLRYTFRRQQFGLVLGHERVDDLAERLALDHLRQFIEREIDAVVGHSPLREIVGADALGTVAGADLAAAFGGAGGVLLLPLEAVEPRAQHRHGLGAVPMLRAVLLHHHHNPGRDVGHAHRRFGLVHVLAAGAAGP